MSRTRSIVLTVLRAGFGIGLLVYLGTSGSIHWKSLLGLALAWRLTLVALVLLWIDFVIVAWRLCVLMAPLDAKLSLNASTRLTLIGQFFSTFLPGGTGGDLMKIYYVAHGNKGRRTEVATIIILDRAVGMFAMILLPLLLAPFFPALVGSSATLRKLLWFAAATCAAMLTGFLVCLSSRVRQSRLLLWAFRRLPLGSYAERMFDTLHGFGHHAGALFGAVGISLLAHLLTAAILLLLAGATGGQFPGLEVSMLVPLGFLVNTLPLTPGGLGVGEAAFERLFHMVHLNNGAESLLGWRLLTTVISLLGLIYYLQGRKQFLEAARDVPGAAIETAAETSVTT